MAKYQSTVAFVVTYLASIIVVKYIESPLDKKRKKMTTKEWKLNNLIIYKLKGTAL